MLSKKLSDEEMQHAADFFTSGIRQLANRPIRLMEVCGTHTVAIFRAGIRELLPPEVELVSGPGCPVCVTPNEYLDTAIAYSRQSDVILTTFGDMLKVPGSSSSLMAEKRGSPAASARAAPSFSPSNPNRRPSRPNRSKNPPRPPDSPRSFSLRESSSASRRLRSLQTK